MTSAADRRSRLPRALRRALADGPGARWPKRVLKSIVWLAGVGVFGIFLGLASVFLYLDPQIPSTDTYRHYRFETPLRMYTADGRLFGEFGERRLIPMSLDRVPQQFLDALLNTEDKRFYEHNGIDFISLGNDAMALLFSDVRTGASTITMQLAKIISFSHRQVLIRKFKEMLLALKVEQELTKNEILALYVNSMSFGKRAYGLQAAAHTYYGKPAETLDLAQLAMLAGIIKKPEGGNPINGPEWALARRNLVLRRMLAQESITPAEYQQAVAAPITAREFRRDIEVDAPYPAEWVRQQLYERYGEGIYSGYVVHTTLSSERQLAAQRALRRGLLDYDLRHGFRGPEGSVVVAFHEPGDGAAVRLDVAATAAGLGGYRAVGGLQPAVVVEVAERSATTVLGDGTLARVDWDGLRWRPFVDTDVRGPTPKTAAEIVSVGDVIRLWQDPDGLWRLRQLPEIQGALVALEPRTGAIRALVGGWDFHARQFNHALQARRQPGSGFKPVVYSAALDQGVTPASEFMDVPRVFEDANLETAYRPRNDSGTFTGLAIPLRRALYKSINSVSIGVMMRIGPQPILDHAGRFGFDRGMLPRNTQLAIGGGTMAVTPIEMARAYAVIANGGFLIEPHIVDRVELDDGASEVEVVFEPSFPEACEPCADAVAAAGPEDTASTSPPVRSAPRAIAERNAFVMDSMLRDVIRRGTGARAGATLRRPDLAGKTGTTNDATDTWFNGYHPNLVAVAWAGFSDQRSTGQGEYGSKTPLSIWIEFMREALADEPVVTPLVPEGVVSVSMASGGMAAADDPASHFEYFFSDNLPVKVRRGARTTAAAKTAQPEDIF